MIDYIDDCFDLITFPDQDFVDYQRKNYYNIDNLFVFSDELKINRMKKTNFKNPYIGLFSNYEMWSMTIQSMRYDLEISLMFLLFYFNKGIPEFNRDIENLYSKYNWSKCDIQYDDNNPSNVEQRKKLFNSFTNYFVHSLITFVNNIENQIVYIFNFKNDKIFSYNYTFTTKDINVFADEIREDLTKFINEFKAFLYISTFKEIREFRNTMVHKNTPFIFRLNTEIFQPNNTYAVSSMSEEVSANKLINNIKECLLLIENQCKKFNRIVNQYFLLLSK